MREEKFQDQVYESMEAEISFDKMMKYAAYAAIGVGLTVLVAGAFYVASKYSERFSHLPEKPHGIESRLDKIGYLA